jgi:hypothetical protein
MQDLLGKVRSATADGVAEERCPKPRFVTRIGKMARRMQTASPRQESPFLQLSRGQSCLIVSKSFLSICHPDWARRILVLLWVPLLLSLLALPSNSSADSGLDGPPAVSAASIEYWNALNGVTTHFFEKDKAGGFSILTTFRPPNSKQTRKATAAVLTAKDFAELVAFLDDPETERIFANLKIVPGIDGESVAVKLYRNNFF